MGVKEEESNRDPLWKWMHPLRMEQHTQGREIIKFPLVCTLPPNAMIDQVRAPLFINADHILPAAGFSYTALRMKGKSTLQFHLKFISICHLQFIRDIAGIPWYVCQSLLVKRSSWLLSCHHQTSFKDTMLAFERYCFIPVKFDRFSVNSVWDIKSRILFPL